MSEAIRTDRNFKSYDTPEQIDVDGAFLDPVGAGWVPGTWSDTCKFYKRQGCTFRNFEVVVGGVEDAVDANHNCGRNLFENFDVASGGGQVLTLKGNSNHNTFRNWRIRRGGSVVDIEIGNWSSYNRGLDKGNTFDSIHRDDGKPVTYCYRMGCKPTFVNSKVRHLWWRSIGLTVYWWAKSFWHDVLRVPDN